MPKRLVPWQQVGAPRPPVRSFLLFLGAIVLAGVLAVDASPGGFPRFGAGCTRADFSSQGGTVRAEFCRAAHGFGGAAIVLHGCGGFSTFDHRIVSDLPQYGISTLDVDYFALTPPAGTKGFCNGAGGRGFDDFGVWTQIALDAEAKLLTLPGIHHAGIVAGRRRRRPGRNRSTCDPTVRRTDRILHRRLRRADRCIEATADDAALRGQHRRHTPQRHATAI